ncbi:MAG: hypothetical protein AAF193_11315, partial [Bacteroidota bacterium]
MKWALSILCFFFFAIAIGQQDSVPSLSAEQAKRVVSEISKYAGLSPSFVVREDADVRTAVAYIKSNDRYIAFNPKELGRINFETGTRWASISIFAHEIAHHLMGHTLDVRNLGPGDELACDKFSGFILNAMGATEEEAIAAIQAVGPPKPGSI